ncbi:hypothetical protein [Kribbella deserti]|uniref:Uncharacterized protein n=1 Tax=Kribbella deserti TaxID=1926257 RepID=A0ABV6QED3_9ACTN
MTATESRPAVPAQEVPTALPLQPEDPPRVGDFWLRGRLSVTPAGFLYAARNEDGKHAVVAMMAEGSADDAAARERFQRAVDQVPADLIVGRNTEDDDDLALWAAIGPVVADNGSSSSADSRAIAERHGGEILSAVLMDRIPHIGKLRGPDFRHYWESRRRPGLFRLWPLPWPAALKSASWLAILLSLVTMLVLMLAALLIAWLLFKDKPNVDPEPLIPPPSSTVTVTITPTTPPPASPSPTGTGSPTPSGSPTTSSSPTPGGTEGTIPTNVPSSGTVPTNPADRY